MGHRIHYYLTGNGRCGDMLDIVAEMGMTKYGWGGYERVAQRFGHSGGADGLGTGLQGILVAWERTGDAKYGEAIKAAFSDKSCGAYRYMHPKGSWNTGMTTAFGTFQALEEYADLTGNELAKQILIDNAKMVRDDTKMHTSWMWPGSFIPIVAAAYRFTGDESLGTLLKDMIGKQVGKGVGGGNAAPAIAYAIESLKIHGDK